MIDVDARLAIFNLECEVARLRRETAAAPLVERDVRCPNCHRKVAEYLAVPFLLLCPRRQRFGCAPVSSDTYRLA
jgi:hypothetical protein